jgi:MFS family permease
MLRYIKERQIKLLPPVYLFALSIFFWTLFDSVLMYVTPLLMEERGFSIGIIGLIIGTSSMSGAIFDFFICKFFKNSDFRRIYLTMFAICLLYPLLLSQANNIWLFLFAMSVWGIYFDFYGFGAFNFIGRYTKPSDHSTSFGIVQVFRALGGVLAPLLAGLVIASSIDWQIFAMSWIFLGIGFVFFILLLFFMRKYQIVDGIKCDIKRNKSLSVEINLWKKLSMTIRPVLFITFFLSLAESFFWTLAPLYVAIEHLGKFGGLFLTAYVLPALFIGWFVGNITNRFGKKRTAICGILIGSAILTTFFYISSPVISIAVVFLASFFINFAPSSVNAAYADYISEVPNIDTELEGLEGFSGNFGYIVGPILAGILANLINISVAFSILGVIGVVLSIILLIVTPKSIDIKISDRSL